MDENAKWEKRRAVTSLIEIAANALQTANAILPDQDECVNETQLALKNKVDELRYQVCTLDGQLNHTDAYKGWEG